MDLGLHKARALLIESNALLRSVCVAQLRDLGIGHVAHTARARDARMLLENQPFDIVVCSREFEGSDYSGVDLLDELRRERLLPYSTVFVMVSAGATYHQVVEAAESSLDALLIRPFTAAMLSERLLEARQRKLELGDLLRALDAGELDMALKLSLGRFQQREIYWRYCGRVTAELLLTRHRPQDAEKIFEKLAQSQDDTWAELGIARCHIARSDLGKARKTLAGVIEREPGSADAYELMGRVLLEQGDFPAAAQAFHSAATITPGCLLRAQQAGAMAFYQGQTTQAMYWLERTLSIGVRSKLFDAMSLVLLALLHFDKGNTAGVLAMTEQLSRVRERLSASPRLQRLEAAAKAVAALSGNSDPQESLTQLAEESRQDNFDFDSARSTLAAWARVPAASRLHADYEGLVERLALRFCISRNAAEMLTVVCGREEIAVMTIRRCQAQLAAVTEEAMEQSLRGDASAAVNNLLREGQRTLNAKLLEMAASLARRHRATIDDADSLAERALAHVQRSGHPINLIGNSRESGRTPGGLQLRLRIESVSIEPAI
jgi:predicted Zn-dependent protease